MDVQSHIYNRFKDNGLTWTHLYWACHYPRAQIHYHCLQPSIVLQLHLLNLKKIPITLQDSCHLNVEQMKQERDKHQQTPHHHLSLDGVTIQTNNSAQIILSIFYPLTQILNFWFKTWNFLFVNCFDVLCNMSFKEHLPEDGK